MLIFDILFIFYVIKKCKKECLLCFDVYSPITESQTFEQHITKCPVI